MKAAHPELGMKEIAIRLGQEWNQLSEAQKATYKAKAMGAAEGDEYGMDDEEQQRAKRAKIMAATELFKEPKLADEWKEKFMASIADILKGADLAQLSLSKVRESLAERHGELVVEANKEAIKHLVLNCIKMQTGSGNVPLQFQSPTVPTSAATGPAAAAGTGATPAPSSSAAAGTQQSFSVGAAPSSSSSQLSGSVGVGSQALQPQPPLLPSAVPQLPMGGLPQLSAISPQQFNQFSPQIQQQLQNAFQQQMNAAAAAGAHHAAAAAAGHHAAAGTASNMQPPQLPTVASVQQQQPQQQTPTNQQQS